jgi:hypothetical protein
MRILLLAWFLLAIVAPLPAQAVQLRSGEVLFGEIDPPPDENGLTLRRFDNGGVLHLRWDQLSPASAKRLREASGLSVEEESEYLVDAELLEYLLPGGGLRQMVGRRVREDDASITFRSRGQDWVVQRNSLRSIREVSVPVLQVMTNSEFYNEQLAAIGITAEVPADAAARIALADRHILLADVMLRVRDYDRAEQHLKAAQELGGGNQPALLEGKLERLKTIQGSKAERDLIDEIQAARARSEFDRAGELIAQYEQKYATGGKLKTDFTRAKLRVQEARQAHYVRRVTEKWYGSILELAQRKSREPGVTLAAARSYAESQLGRDLRQHVAKLLKLEPAEVEELWGKRKEYRVARADRYLYGIGSWVLGKDEILKGTKQGESDQTQRDKQSDEEKEIERLARKIADARRRALAAGGGGGAKEYTPEDWWKAATPTERDFFIRAYYAEFGGDLEVTHASVDECLTCAGQGTIATLSDVGQSRNVKCPTCQGTRFKRAIRAQ